MPELKNVMLVIKYNSHSHTRNELNISKCSHLESGLLQEVINYILHTSIRLFTESFIKIPISEIFLRLQTHHTHTLFLYPRGDRR